MVRGFARGLKVFREALDPTSETLHRLTAAGDDIRVLGTASWRGELTPGPASVIEITAAEDSGEPPLTLELPGGRGGEMFESP